MAAAKRQFRTPESYQAEQQTRDAVRPFLESRGFQDVTDQRIQNGQTMQAISPTGERVTMRVRLCWRRGSSDSRGPRPYAAAQLLADISDQGWEESLRTRFAREEARGITHQLFVQAENGEIVLAALIPSSQIVPIWSEQRAVYQHLIDQGRTGRRKANPAENGQSPTLYLQDDNAPEAASVVWSHREVLSLVSHTDFEDRSQAHEVGAGFGTPEENRLVEERAIATVTSDYTAKGWEVHSVERNRCGFDLVCRKFGEVENVEVKGVRGAEQEFIITHAEVRQAETNPCFILVVVTSALSETPTITRYSGRDFTGRFALTAIQYRAKLRDKK